MKFGTDYNGSKIETPTASTAVNTQGLEKALRDVIHNFHGENFTVTEIFSNLAAAGQDFSRSGIFDGLATLQTDGFIEVVQKGAGRRAAIYKQKMSTAHPE